MPGKIKVKILAGRNLPVMDRSGDTTDAYVELKFGNVTYKTDVCRKSLNPQWNSEWYKFEVDDAELQDEPLQIRLMDHDTYSANDAIGKVYINLNPLLLPGIVPSVKNIWTLEAAMNSSTGSQGSVMSGWIPVYDTMHGIRGEVNIIVKVELFSDFNKFRQSSCGIQFFYSPNIPHGYYAQVIHGFVEELIVSDDPEYKWIDKIRTPRASNEARQTLFFKLSGEVQRKIGLKALDLGGNAVIGYLQNFDLEGESGIVARGIGTAVTLMRLHDTIGETTTLEDTSFAFSSQSKVHTECTRADNKMPLYPMTSSFLYAPSLPNRYANYVNIKYEGYRYPNSRPIANTVKYITVNSDGNKTEQIFHKTSKSGGSKESNTSLFPSKFLIDNETTCSLSSRLKNIKQLSQSILGLPDSSVKSDVPDELKNNAEIKSTDDSSSDISFVINAYQYVQKKMLTRDKHSGGKMAAALIKSICQDTWLDEGNENSSDIQTAQTSPARCLFCTSNADDSSIEMYPLKKCEHTPRMDTNEKLNITEVTDLENDNEDSPLPFPSEMEASNSLQSQYDYKILEEPDNTAFTSETMELEYESECIPLLSSSETETTNSSQTQNDYTILEESENITDLIGTVESKCEDEWLPLLPLSDANALHFSRVHKNTLEEFENIVESDIQEIQIPVPVMKHYVFPQSKNNGELNNVDDEGQLEKSVDEKLEDEYDKFSGHVISADNKIFNKATKQVRKTHENKNHNKRSNLLKHNKQLMTSTQSLPTLNLTSNFEKHSQNRSHILSHNTPNKIHRHHGKHIETVNENDSPSHRHEPRIRKNYSGNSANRKGSERLESMLNLIKIIDTKMMQLTDDDKYDFIETKRKKRNKTVMSTSNLPEKHKENFSHITTHPVMKRVSSCPKHLSSRHFATPLSRNHSRSFKTSLKCVHKPNDFHTSLCLLDKPHNASRSKRSSPLSASPKYQRYNSYDAIGKSMIDHSDINSFINSVSINTFDSSKSRSTTHLTPSKKIESVMYEYHSALNLRDAAYCNRFTKSTNATNVTYNSCVSYPFPHLRQQDETSVSPSYPLLAAPPSMVAKTSQSPMTKAPLHRRSSDSDLSVTPKGNSFPGSDRSTSFLRSSAAVVRAMNQDALEMLEYPFITMQQYPPGFILHIGGLVSSRSVKLLERISNLEEPESRDSWWTEIRMEVRSHARALACNVVIGYREETSICDDVCVLNATGTAAVINLHNSSIGEDQDNMFLSKLQQGLSVISGDTDREKNTQKMMTAKGGKNEDTSNQPAHQNGKIRHVSESNEHETFYLPPQSGCSICHIPYSEVGVPFKVDLSKCAICKRAKVPDVMFSTAELPEGIPLIGRGCFIQATVCKNKKDLRGELNAKEISDCLPFLEYELHSLLLNKLRVKGMNAVFGLKLQVSIGERFIIGMAVGTAVFLSALPAASIPQIASGNSWHDEEKLAEIQKELVETVKRNREFYQLKPIGGVENGKINHSDTDESDDDLPELDLGFGARDSYILEVDDIEDMDRISLLLDDRPPDDFHVVNTQVIPGLEDLEIVRNLQMFAQVSRIKIPMSQVASMPSKYLAKLLQTVYFKLRRMVPCALCNMQFKVGLPEPDELQLSVIGMVLGLGEPIKMSKAKRKLLTQSSRKDQDDNDMIFNLDEDNTENASTLDNITNNNANTCNSVITPGQKARQRSPLTIKTHTTHRHKHVPLKERYGVDITPLSYLPGGKINRYLGNLNFFFIRESTSIRENGGLSGFTHSFVMEVLAIVRAHVTALGGNAMVAFFMTQCVLLHSPHKNQGQCLINVGGDVVSVSYYTNEKQNSAHNC